MSFRFYFHLTNGRELIIDRAGRRTRSLSEIEVTAYSMAGQLMSEAPGWADWSGWLVSVHDGNGGMVTVVPFPAGQA
jgi:hypothetical protein